MARERYTSTDDHTGGEPFRIVEALPVAIPGEDVPRKREHALASAS